MLYDILRELGTTISLALAAILGIAATHKLMDRARMTEAVTALSGLSPALAPVALMTAAAVESAAALLLLWPQTAGLGAVLAGFLWSGYLGLIVMAIARGRRSLDCGCSFGKRHAPLGRFDILRNITLILLAVLVVVAPPAATAFADPAAILAAFGFVLLYAAADQISALVVYNSVHHRN